METERHILYEINARVWLGELSRASGGEMTLAKVPEEEIERIAALGADLVWLLGVWQTGPKAIEIARSRPDLEAEYRKALPDFHLRDVAGSPYSVADYEVDPRLGGREGLAALRKRLERKGIGLVLDFVPNHIGRDHDWVASRPELLVQGTGKDLEEEPGNYFQAKTKAGPRAIAHGRDPYFPGWTDTAQVNFRRRSAWEELGKVLEGIAGQCDGVRCDMAMLALEEVFARVWGDRPLRTAGSVPTAGEFWSEAIGAVRRKLPGFLFIAEAYWGLEYKLQCLGFDFTYDKVLYDRLRGCEAESLRAHLTASEEFQGRCVRFLENHDEDRAAAAFPPDRLRAAAVVAATIPGMLLLHEGQLEGRKVKVPVQLCRRPEEEPDEAIRSFYARLLAAVRSPVLRRGRWRSLPLREAWEGNPTWRNFLAFEWEGAGGLRLAAVNFSPRQGQCYVEFSREEWKGSAIDLKDLLGEATYPRDGDELLQKGLYLDLPGFGHHLFEVVAPARLQLVP